MSQINRQKNAGAKFQFSTDMAHFRPICSWDLRAFLLETGGWSSEEAPTPRYFWCAVCWGSVAFNGTQRKPPTAPSDMGFMYQTGKKLLLGTFSNLKKWYWDQY